MLNVVANMIPKHIGSESFRIYLNKLINLAVQQKKVNGISVSLKSFWWKLFQQDLFLGFLGLRSSESFRIKLQSL